MAAYRRVYDSRHLQADCQAPGSAPEPYARQSSMGYLYLLMSVLANLVIAYRICCCVASTTTARPQLSINVCCRRRRSAANPPAAVAAVLSIAGTDGLMPDRYINLAPCRPICVQRQ